MPTTFWANNSGQSAVEYLIVCFCLVAAIITMPSIYQTMSNTMSNKFKSYAFGVAISDPPTKEFDDSVQKVEDIIHKIERSLGAIGDLIKDLFGLSHHAKLPPVEAVEKLVDTLKQIFAK